MNLELVSGMTDKPYVFHCYRAISVAYRLTFSSRVSPIILTWEFLTVQEPFPNTVKFGTKINFPDLSLKNAFIFLFLNIDLKIRLFRKSLYDLYLKS